MDVWELPGESESTSVHGHTRYQDLWYFLRRSEPTARWIHDTFGPYVITKNLGKGLYALELVADRPTRRVHACSPAPKTWSCSST